MSLDSSDGQTNDTALMARIAARDRRAFELFAGRHNAKCVAVARRVLGNASDAEEVVQEALLRVWEHAADWRGSNAQATTWLYRIIVNLAIDRRRKSAPIFVPVEHGPVMIDPTPSAYLVLEGRDLETRVAREIPELPARQRAALSLCYFEGLSCAEAAAAMQISVSATEALLVRARRTLRERLAARDARRVRPRLPSAAALAGLPSPSAA